MTEYFYYDRNRLPLNRTSSSRGPRRPPRRPARSASARATWTSMVTATWASAMKSKRTTTSEARRRYRTEKSVSRELWPLEAPPMCPHRPRVALSIACAQKKRAEWLALSGLLYLTNSTNSRVRSTHLLHTKSPFSRFFGCRRQKSENIVVSARGRRTPQAPTLRILGCANARKYDYKSSSLYSRSIIFFRACFRRGGNEHQDRT